MKQKNRLYLVLLFLVALVGCNSKKEALKNPLIIPPDFHIMPNLEEEKIKEQKNKKTNRDLQELRDLLL